MVIFRNGDGAVVHGISIERFSFRVIMKDCSLQPSVETVKMNAGPLGSKVPLFVLSDKKVIFEEEFQTKKRELRTASEIPMVCDAGSQLENKEFEIINSNGDADESIHDDQSHEFMIKSKSMDTASVSRPLHRPFCSPPYENKASFPL